MQPGSRERWTPERADQVRRAVEREQALAAEIGVVVPVDPVLARSADHVLVLDQIRVFTSAVSIDLQHRTRVPVQSGNPARDLLHGPPAAGRRGRVVVPPGGRRERGRRRPAPTAAPPGSDLLVGVRFGDGRTAMVSGWGSSDEPDSPDDQDKIHLDCFPDGSRGRGVVNRYLLSPVPPAGPMALIVAAPTCGIDRTVRILDGTALQEARSRVQAWWPGDDAPARNDPEGRTEL